MTLIARALFAGMAIVTAAGMGLLTHQPHAQSGLWASLLPAGLVLWTLNGVIVICLTEPYLTSYELVARGPICPTCQYDLHASISETCPECGADVREIRALAGRFSLESNPSKMDSPDLCSRRV